MSDMGSLVGLLRGLAPCKVLVNGEWVNIFDTAADAIAALVAERDALREKISTVYAALEHGDATHRAWLKRKFDDHFAPALQSDSKDGA